MKTKRDQDENLEEGLLDEGKNKIIHRSRIRGNFIGVIIIMTMGVTIMFIVVWC